MKMITQDDPSLVLLREDYVQLNRILQERAIHVSGQFQFFRYTKEASELIFNHSAPNNNH